MRISFNLKNITLLCCGLLATSAVKAQPVNFVVTMVPDKPMPGYKAFLFYKKGPGQFQIDSAEYSGNKFELKGTVAKTEKAVLYIAKSNTNFGRGMNDKPGMSVYLENGQIIVTGKPTYEDAQRSGTPLNKDYQEYLDFSRPFSEKEAVFVANNKAAMDKKDDTSVRALEAEYFKMMNDKLKAGENYFNTHLNSPVAFDWLKNTMNAPQDKSKALALFDKLGDHLKNSTEGKAFLQKIQATVSAELGSMAPDFSAKALNGETISLSSLQGKYVLLDFWASWCVPCRRENPNVLKAYQKFQKKNFTVFAFSLDDSKTAWQKAVEQDKMPWTQVSDLVGFYSPVVYLYGVQSVPNNLLIDPKGKIIARNLRGDELEKTLSKLL